MEEAKERARRRGRIVDGGERERRNESVSSSTHGEGEVIRLTFIASRLPSHSVRTYILYPR